MSGVLQKTGLFWDLTERLYTCLISLFLFLFLSSSIPKCVCVCLFVQMGLPTYVKYEDIMYTYWRCLYIYVYACWEFLKVSVSHSHEA